MRRVKKELSLVDSYRFNKCCYKDVEARINEWMKDYIVANPYSSSCDPVKKRQQWQLTLENKKRNKVPRDVVRAIERVLGNPIYELFGATKEECAEVGILEDHNETPLATLTEEKLKALIAKRQASDNKLNNNTCCKYAYSQSIPYWNIDRGVAAFVCFKALEGGTLEGSFTEICRGSSRPKV